MFFNYVLLSVALLICGGDSNDSFIDARGGLRQEPGLQLRHVEDLEVVQLLIEVALLLTILLAAVLHVVTHLVVTQFLVVILVIVLLLDGVGDLSGWVAVSARGQQARPALCPPPRCSPGARAAVCSNKCVV